MENNIYALLGMSAGGISIVAYIIYAVNTLRGKTKPNKVTWWVLTFAGAIIFASYYSGVKEAAGQTIWIMALPATYVAGPLLIALLSFKYGEKEKNRLQIRGFDIDVDRYCLRASIASLILWGALVILGFKEASLVILIVNILVDLLGLGPTFMKSILRPEGEDLWAWTLETIACLPNIFMIQAWQFDVWIHPAYLFIVNGALMLLLWRGRFAGPHRA